jgi:NADH:ubiquinone oxidoreductase subunit 6 (subunit J)
MPTYVGKILILLGVILVLAGAVIVLRIRIPYLGKLPGDIRIERDGFRFYFPIVTCIVLSILLTLILILLRKKS